MTRRLLRRGWGPHRTPQRQATAGGAVRRDCTSDKHPTTQAPAKSPPLPDDDQQLHRSFAHKHRHQVSDRCRQRPDALRAIRDRERDRSG